MPRPKRICLPNLTYKITSRCHNNCNLLGPEWAKKHIFEIIKIAKSKYNFNLLYYNVIDDYIYLIIKTKNEGESISRIMQYIKARIAEYYNRRMNRTGAFWNERFKDTIIEYLENPQMSFLDFIWDSSKKSLKNNHESKVGEYKYCSINIYLDAYFEPLIEITINDLYLSLGKCFQERKCKFIEAGKYYC